MSDLETMKAELDAARSEFAEREANFSRQNEKAKQIMKAQQVKVKQLQSELEKLQAEKATNGEKEDTAEISKIKEEKEQLLKTLEARESQLEALQGRLSEIEQGKIGKINGIFDSK